MIGGIFSLVAKIIVICYVVFLIYAIVSKDTDIFNRTEYNNLIYDKTPYTVNLTNFDLATRFYYDGTNQDVFINREKYVDIYFTVTEFMTDDTGAWSMTSDRIEAVPCTPDRFVNLTDQVSQLGLADPNNFALCPEHLDA